MIRDIPLLCIEDEIEPGIFAIVVSNFGQGHHPAWYYNLKANPQVSCTLRGQPQDYIAIQLAGDEYQRYWDYALDTDMGFPHYKSCVGDRHIPVFIMKPVSIAAQLIAVY